MAQAKRLVEKEYRLTDNRAPLSFVLNVGRNHNLIVNDKAGLPQAIRLCLNEKSIYIKMQSEYAIVSPVVFMGGLFIAPPSAQITQTFLDAHPGNVLNGGTKFEMIDDEQSAKESIDLEETKVDIKYAIRKKSKEKDGIHALKQVVTVLNGNVVLTDEMGIEQLKEALYLEANSNPGFFIDDAGNVDIFEDEYLKRKYLTLRAIRAGILKESSDRKSILWAKGSSMIYQAPVGQNLIDSFSDFLATDDGILVIESITAKL